MGHGQVKGRAYRGRCPGGEDAQPNHRVPRINLRVRWLGQLFRGAAEQVGLSPMKDHRQAMDVMESPQNQFDLSFDKGSTAMTSFGLDVG